MKDRLERSIFQARKVALNTYAHASYFHNNNKLLRGKKVIFEIQGNIIQSRHEIDNRRYSYH